MLSSYHLLSSRLRHFRLIPTLMHFLPSFHSKSTQIVGKTANRSLLSRPFSRVLMLGLALFSTFALESCKSKKVQDEVVSLEKGDVQAEEREGKAEAALTPVELGRKMAPYALANLDWKLVETHLDLRPDFATRTVAGLADIKLIANRDNQDSIHLDAKYMDIKGVTSGVMGTGKMKPAMAGLPLAYRYDSLQLHVALRNKVQKGATVVLTINYVARPEVVQQAAGEFIAKAKGFYFIGGGYMEDGEADKRAASFYTQGEPVAASCWFPTLDDTRQKHKQEIMLTVPDSLTTLSNGLLTFSEAAKSANGVKMRTDYWRQDLPHSPYLTMVAAGKWVTFKDKWRGKEVTYHVEPYYAPMARKVFGRTPQMIEFFSTKLGVPFAWDKYAQVVVRDFPSGAMENTSAVTNYEGIMKGPRELREKNSDDIICHELFHHWFGDLVTTMDWSDLVVNEGMATYGEYLWFEYAKGKYAAEQGRLEDLQVYAREVQEEAKLLVRRDYKADPNSMFDRHSYQKGGLVIHALRAQVGDGPFFEGLKLYLNRHRFGNGTAERLREAMEETSGQDLRWFFEQYMERAGSPILNYAWRWDASKGEAVITMAQTLFGEGADQSVYRLPFAGAAYTASGDSMGFNVTLTKGLDSFRVKLPQMPAAVIVDPWRVMPGIVNLVTEDMTEAQLIATANYAPHTLERSRALGAADSRRSEAKEPLSAALRAVAVKNLTFPMLGARGSAISVLLDTANQKASVELLLNQAKNDPSPDIREECASLVDDYLDKKDLITTAKAVATLKEIIRTDSTKSVPRAALVVLGAIDSVEALKISTTLEADSELVGAVVRLRLIYAPEASFGFVKRQVLTPFGSEIAEDLHFRVASAFLNNESDIVGQSLMDVLSESAQKFPARAAALRSLLKQLKEEVEGKRAEMVEAAIVKVEIAGGGKAKFKDEEEE